jgi:GT2 family glycosyltransferase
LKKAELKTRTQPKKGEIGLSFSIVILSHNSTRFIRKCLSTVIESQGPNYEIIFVDNGSSDESVEIASTMLAGRPNSRIIKSAVNLGFAAGNNLGAAAATGDILVFLNVDTEVEKGWLHGFESTFTENTDIGVIQAKLLLGDRKTFDSAGDIVDFFGFGTSLGGSWGEKDIGQYDRPREIFAARGAGLAIRRNLFRLLDGFDDSYFLDYEDIDLSWRSWLMGYRVLYEPRSVIVHYASPRNPNTRSNTRTYHPLKNRYASLLKNYDIRNVLKFVAPAFLVFPPFYLAGAARRRSPRSLIVALRAIVWILSNSQVIMSKRALVQTRGRTVPDSIIQSHMMRSTLKRRLQFHYLSWRLTDSQVSRWYAQPAIDQISQDKSAPRHTV